MEQRDPKILLQEMFERQAARRKLADAADANELQELLAQLTATERAAPDVLSALPLSPPSSVFTLLVKARTEHPRVRRPSLFRTSFPGADIDWIQPGRFFRFVNRSAECREILKALCDLEDMRVRPVSGSTSERWSALVRDTAIISVTGMPGVGKTAAARLALFHLAVEACGNEDPQAIVATASTLASSIKRPRHVGFIRSLLRSCLSDRNLRLDVSRLDVASTTGGLASALLQEWGKHTIGFADAAVGLHSSAVSLIDAVRLILNETETCGIGSEVRAGGVGKETDSPDPDEGPPSLFINLDEAHVLRSDSLSGILRQIVDLLITQQLRVFVIVTGVTSDQIQAAFDDSSLRCKSISLPLLDLDHIVEVAEGLLPLPGGMRWHTSRVLMHTLWWTGGVPRSLEHLICAAATRSPRSRTAGSTALTCDAVAQWLSALSWVEGHSLVEAMAARLFRPTERVEYTDALRDAFSFALLEVNVPRTHTLAPHTSPITIDNAQKHSMLYWFAERGVSAASLGGPTGRIVLPPLALYAVQRTYVPSPQHIYLLKYIVPFMSSRDNESVAVGALMHKCLALFLLGKTTTTLTDLGIPPTRSPARLHNPSVSLPVCFDVVRTGGNVTAASFESFVSAVRGTPAAQKVNTAIAFVNGPTASFADAFIVLPDFVIYVQERQRVLARLRALREAVNPHVSVVEVTAEYEKLGCNARALPHVFLYITDDSSMLASDVATLPYQCRVVAADAHPALLGRMCAFLRRQSLSWSAIDASSAAVGRSMLPTVVPR